MLLPILSPRPELFLFAITSYVGNGAARSIVTGQNLAAGGLFVGKKTNAASAHYYFDTARGATNALLSNQTASEFTDGVGSSFNATGMTFSSTSSINGSGGSFVAFSWLEQAGYMDVVTYTGDGPGDGSQRAVAQALGKEASLIIIKARDSIAGYAQNWIVHHSSMPSNTHLAFNTHAGQSIGFNISSNASNLLFQNSTTLNYGGIRYVVYLFAEKVGKSKFGSYTGNSGTRTITGLGFRPKAVLLKNRTAVADWVLIYNDNGTTYIVYPSLTAARESATGSASLDSDGFTLTSANALFNRNTDTYIYGAWA